MRSSKFAKILMILIAVALIASVLLACTERTDPIVDDIGKGDPTDSGTELIKKKETVKDAATASDAVRTATDNANNLYRYTDDPEWYVISLDLAYDFVDYKVRPYKEISIGVVLQMNIHMTDNSKSEMYLQVSNFLQEGNTLLVGLYYYAGTLYVNIGDKAYYAEEINLTNLAMVLIEPLMGLGVDVPWLLANLLAGETFQSMPEGHFLKSLGKTLATVIGMLFDDSRLYKITTTGLGIDNIDYQYCLTPNGLLGLVGGLGITDMLWGALGMNLDPVLEAILGFSLDGLLSRKWPTMETDSDAWPGSTVSVPK